jgi:hypothetical protein
MSALIKSSILLLLAIAIGAYLCELSAGEAAPPASSSPAREATSATSDDACKQDEERLAKLQAKPSLDEAFLFGSELRCPNLWPQLLAILDSLSHTAESAGVSNPNGAAPDTISAGGAAPPASPSPVEATSATSDDACKQDEDRLAKLRAKPSLDEAMRFESELRCLKLWPQLLAILDSLSHTAESAGVSSPNGAAPDTMSAGGAAPPASSSPPMEATSATSDDACKQDEERLAKLQAKPSVDEAIRFERELRCPKLRPQLLTILDGLSRAAESAGVSSPNGAAPGTMSAGGAAPPASSSPAMEATSATSDDACKHDEDRLAKLQAKPSLDEVIRFEREAKCPKVWPQLLAILKVMRDPAHSDESSGVAASAPVADEPPHPTERTADALDANVGSDEVCKPDEERLARLRRSPSSDEAARFAGELSCEKLRPQLLALTGDLASPAPPDSGGDPKDAGTEMNATNEAPPASEAAADADRRIAGLERERDALAAEVGRLKRHRDSTSPRQANPPAPPQPAIPAERSDLEPSPASASLPDGMPARVLIRYLSNNADARAQAEKLANALKRQGVEVVDLRESRTAIRTELSFSYAPDEAIAQQVGRLVGVAPVRRLPPKDGLMVRPGTLELNLSGDSHLAVIKTTSTRESNHE